MADIAARGPASATYNSRSSLHKLMQRKSTIAFLMALPLILLITVLVAYPAGYAVYLATLNKGMTRFVGFGNFEFLFGRDTFWLVVYQSCLFAITAVFGQLISNMATALIVIPIAIAAANSTGSSASISGVCTVWPSTMARPVVLALSRGRRSPTQADKGPS